MSEGAMRDEELREAFQARTSTGACSDQDLDRVWRAVSGELDAAQRRALVERLAADPALADAWRVAAELWRQSSVDTMPAERMSPRWWSRPARLAAAAAVVLAVAGSLVWLRDRQAGDALREQAPAAIEALLPDDAVLPREAFVLRWTPGPAESRYDVRVTTENLRLVATASALERAELMVPPALLAGVESGSRLLWQVDAVLADGSRNSSPTFVVTLR